MIGNAAFICEDEVDERQVAEFTSAQPNHCSRCRPPVSWDTTKTHKILEHVAAHLLFDSGLDTSQELCGLCMRSSPLCTFYLRKGKGASSAPQIELRTSRCPNLISKFFYAAASTESTNSPCTNIPVVCPLCPSTSSAVWKYNMKTHLIKTHPSVRSSDVLTAYTISESEKAALRLRWDKRHKASRQRQTRRGNVTQTPLTISEVHSSRQVLLYVSK